MGLRSGAHFLDLCCDAGAAARVVGPFWQGERGTHRLPPRQAIAGPALGGAFAPFRSSDTGEYLATSQGRLLARARAFAAHESEVKGERLSRANLERAPRGVMRILRRSYGSVGFLEVAAVDAHGGDRLLRWFSDDETPSRFYPEFRMSAISATYPGVGACGLRRTQPQRRLLAIPFARPDWQTTHRWRV